MKSAANTTNKRLASKLKKEQFWHGQIDAYRASGQSAKQWSEENKINVHTLASWITKLGRQQNRVKSNTEKEVPIQEEGNTTAGSPASQVHEAVNELPPETIIPLEISNQNEQVVKIKHGAITITAEIGYNKDTLLSLLQTLFANES